MNYKKELTDSYESWRDNYESKLSFICECVFSISTYEDEMAEIIGQKMLDVCEAILCNKTHFYINDKDNRMNYLTMVNMPFLKDKIEWGASIRGAWFNDYKSDKEIVIGEFSLIPKKDLTLFIKDLIEWSKEDEDVSL